MKKWGLWLLCGCLLLSLAACGAPEEPSAPEESTPETTTTTESRPKAVAFAVRHQVRDNNSRFFSNVTGLKGYVLHSPEELQEKLPEDWQTKSPSTQEDVIDPREYPTAFFGDKALVLLCITEPSGSIRFAVDELVTEGDTLTVRYTATRPNPATADMAYWYVLLETSRADVEGVLAVEGHRIEKTLPSGETLP